MFTQKISLVGSVNHNRIIGNSFFLKVIQQFPNIVVDSSATSDKIFYQFLMGFSSLFDAVQAFYRKRQPGILCPKIGIPGIFKIPIAKHFQFLPGKCTTSRFRTKIIKSFRFGNFYSVEQIFKPIRVIKRLMGGFEMAHHHERLCGIPFFHPVDGQICNHIG